MLKPTIFREYDIRGIADEDLLSPDVEIKLAKSASRQIPLNPQVKLDSIKHIQTPQTVRALAVDFAKATENWNASQEFLVKEFGLR